MLTSNGTNLQVDHPTSASPGSQPNISPEMIEAYLPIVAPMIGKIVDERLAAERENTVKQVIAGIKDQLTGLTQPAAPAGNPASGRDPATTAALINAFSKMQSGGDNIIPLDTQKKVLASVLEKAMMGGGGGSDFKAYRDGQQDMLAMLRAASGKTGEMLRDGVE